VADPVVVDTYVFNRSVMEDGVYRDVYLALIRRRDRVLFTEQIVDEYVRMAPKAGLIPALIGEEIIPYLKSREKWQVTGNRALTVGPRQDRPFIGAALEGRARYIISNDPGLRRRPVLDLLDKAGTEVLYPHEYASLGQPRGQRRRR
jgi:predicted nucleic acid-binding protein